MDPCQDISEVERTKKKGLLFFILQWIFALLLPIIFLLSLPFLVGFLVVLIANSSIMNPISMHTQCKIVSSKQEKLPSFSAAWLTQYRFKVNETYRCWHTSGVSKVRLYQDDNFSCHPDEPSSFETIRRYSIMTMDMVNSWFSSRGRAKYLKWETIAGLVSGFSTSLISIGFVRFVQRLLSSSNRYHVTWKFPRPVNLVLIKRACLLLAYLSFVAWLVLRYGKKLGLTGIQRF
ncbi:hypothetical protein L6164_020371 [Bauhinia variegata]|uniref:Uncharacterized protein n=1 Tax=Bauhinia variegata TaxID=167791 RepID=A0ACB9MWW3_BAUVA|nr:hypothetical protein L6164_020371 [Bauhinia variegata]